MEDTTSIPMALFDGAVAGGNGGTLLVGATPEPWRACRAVLRDALDGIDALLGVAVERGAGAFVDDWRDWVDGDRELAVVDVGEASRSATVAEGIDPGRSPASALPYSALASLPEVAGSYLDDWHAAGHRAAVHVEDTTTLVAESDLPTVVAALSGLLARGARVGADTYVTAHSDAPSTVTDALVPLFETVIDVDGDGATSVRDRTPSLSLDRTFDLLAPSRRRHALQFLAARDGPTSVGELAEAVSARADVGREHAEIALRQFDLPKLTDAGVVVHDDATGAVERGVRFDSLRPLLALAAGVDHEQ